jgi:hypothetical protein
MYESPPEASKSFVSLNAPTELKQYGFATVCPLLSPVERRAHSTLADSVGVVLWIQFLTMPSHVLSRMTVFTPSQKTRWPSGETSHTRSLSAGSSIRQ